jgi:hypothetical protein
VVEIVMHTPEAFGAFVEIAASGRSESARVAAAVAILGRGWGRPPMAEERADDAHVKVVYLPAPCKTVEEWQERYNLPRGVIDAVSGEPVQ